MCGFSGILFHSESIRDRFPPALNGFRQAARRIAHRGNTEHREQLSERFWLSHYRLAFQDISAGQQPMPSHDREHLILFNGEVYNHLQLRDAIVRQSGIRFKTRSDTETLIEGWKAFGEVFFEQLEGEYAFVILARNGSGFIAHRDRFGVKPLFLHADGIDSRTFASFSPEYSFSSGILEFASEIKGITSPKRWNRDGLLRQFVGLFEPICTPFEQLIQIPPGAILRARRNGEAFNCTLRTATTPIRQSVRGSRLACEDEFEQAFSQSVQERLLSDVELGVYLSGGVDSKAVAFELGRLTGREQPMKTFTVGFKQAGYDESEEALRFARHLGFNPHLVRIDGTALDYAYPLAVQNSELVQPFTNGAAKWWLSRFTRQYVHGVLTGDGADELLCGYPSYRYANWWRFVMRGRGQAETRGEILQLLERIPLGTRGRDQLYNGRFAAHSKNPWLAGSSAAGSGQDFVDSIRLLGVPHPLFGQIQAITQALLGDEAESWLASQASSIQSWFGAGLAINDALCAPDNALLVWQNYFAKTHLPVLILNWVGDRMEMANTLEGRTPFLSGHMRRLIHALPDHALVSGLRDKVLLRRSYARRFPPEFAQTPKKQFNAPFLDSAQLIKRFNSDRVFELCGLTEGLRLQGLLDQAKAVETQDPFLATHLRSAHQTAICLSIVHQSIVKGEQIEQDPEFEQHYLAQGGPV
ncbi:asparagine synthetase B family protein [Candidatus Endoriftia persephonae]|jgi:asparagine synthase (glutamine-hydrolysing)|uniref:asparagine synthase (glutamine-hydrolyzing) n=2 Tax=Gammaproteobacteria TaxID=1236 RepID=G2FGT6_9GAMM|nr:asparagine synthase-related protein [Candidatus Endoriftia persephone]EGW54050.1 asparagine synthase (glutamine-hydrolysing) [endosymbiont of Tevnia jerichonana (vent Tica)]USF86596.1 asparagine synthetase B [Candidatus Endoriftia persephone]